MRKDNNHLPKEGKQTKTHKLTKYYSIVNGTIINLKNCKVLQGSLPKAEEIIEAIQNKQIPLYVYTEEILWGKIQREIQYKASTKLGFPIIPIMLGDANTIPVCLIGTQKAFEYWKAIEEKKKQDKIDAKAKKQKIEEEEVEKKQPYIKLNDQMQLDQVAGERKKLKQQVKKLQKEIIDSLKVEETNV